MSQRFTLKIADHLDSPAGKRHYTEQLFTEISPRYDLITRLLSFWRDASWKRDLIAALPAQEKPFCLDLACGTGDITQLLAARYPQGRIVGLDITESMLTLARARSTHPNINFVHGDMNRLGFDPESADIVSGGYALRNAPDLQTAIDEVHQVLKPGGTAGLLDFSKPSGRLAQEFEYWLLKLWAGFWGLLLHRNHEVYSYIAESMRRFPDRRHLHRLFTDKGFQIIQSKLYLFGIMELLILQKTDPPQPSVEF